MKHILVVDDELGSRESLQAIFSKDYKVTTASSADQAAEVLSAEKIDLMLLDVMMPHKTGIEFLNEVQQAHFELPVIMVSASTSVRSVVDAIRQGAYDYVTKPFDIEEVRLMAEHAMESRSLKRRVETLESDVSREYPINGIVGESASFLAALDNVKKAAETDATVLICGESGTGKELVARLLHALSNRKDEPFVAVHCAALPEGLMESELFGHEKGAFTHAEKKRLGRFDLAGSGTLFFDEVSEMTLSTQVKLLRVLQEREYMRVGGTQVIRTDARIVAASAQDLSDAIKEKKFREDLYYRLNVVPVFLPPLREREGDIPRLAEFFIHHFKKSMNSTVQGLDEDALHAMANYSWPGNVREMKNILERMLVLHGKEDWIRAEFLPQEFKNATFSPPPIASTDVNLTQAVKDYERQLVESALQEANGVQTRAADILGTTRRILKYRMEKLNISVSDPKDN